MAYHACSEGDRRVYDGLHTPEISLKQCCVVLLTIIEGNGIETTRNRSNFVVISRQIEYFSLVPFCESAIENGHLDCLKLFHENGCRSRSRMICNTKKILDGHVNCVKYANGNQLLDSNSVRYYSAINRHIECLSHLCQSGRQWLTNETTIELIV